MCWVGEDGCEVNKMTFKMEKSQETAIFKKCKLIPKEMVKS